MSDLSFVHLCRLAGRGLKRDIRRTLITGLTISLGLALFIFVDQLSQGSYDALIKRGVAQSAGHLVFEPERKQAPGEARPLISDAHTLATQAREVLSQAGFKPQEARVLNRLWLGGLLRSPTGAARVGVLAVEPEREREVSDWHTRTETTRWFKPDDTRGALLGAALAERLEVLVGDKVVLSYQGPKETESRLFRVRGLLKGPSPSEEGRVLLVTLKGAQEALSTEGGAHQLSVHLSDMTRLAEAQEALQPLLKTLPQGAEPLSLLDWKKALPALWQFAQKDQQSSRVIFMILGLIIALGVLNAVSMSALERKRQFGVLLALGFTPRSIASLLITEGLLLGLGASLLGLVIGELVSWPVVEVGIDISQMMGEGMDVGGVVMDTQLYASWSPRSVATATLITWLFTTLASVWPAYRAAHTPPLEAIHEPLS